MNIREFSRTRIKNHILKVLEMATNEDYVDWYGEAHSWAVSYAGDDVARLIGIVAALSPRKNWESNKEIALKYYKNGGYIPHVKTFAEKAMMIKDSDGKDETIRSILNGAKITSFYNNIRYPESNDNVTIDRHALSIAVYRSLGNKDLQMSKKQYEHVAEAYKYTANLVGLPVNRLQAITWVVWKRIKYQIK